MSATLVAIEGLGIAYGGRPALAGVSLDLPERSITALVGPSGCGKSSLLAAVNRLTDHYEGCAVTGRVLVGGADVRAASTDVLALRKKVGMIFQKPNPFPLSIWKNLALSLKQHGIKDKVLVAGKIEGALRGVGLWDEVKDRLHEPAGRLSGGQQQRLCIARAVVLDPEVLLLDEPCSALDPLSSAVVEELILGMKKRLTLLIVTHNLAQARRIADRTAVFWTQEGVGRLIESGATAQLFEAPSHKITAAYLMGRQG